MAEAVVDDLEAVEVEKEHRELTIHLPPRAPDRKLQVIHEQSPIRETCEGVVKSVVVKLLLRSLAVGHVLNLKNQTPRFGLLVADRRSAQEHPDAMPQPVQITLLYLTGW